jgi:hypothetical protein
VKQARKNDNKKSMRGTDTVGHHQLPCLLNYGPHYRFARKELPLLTYSIPGHNSKPVTVRVAKVTNVATNPPATATLNVHKIGPHTNTKAKTKQKISCGD